MTTARKRAIMSYERLERGVCMAAIDKFKSVNVYGLLKHNGRTEDDGVKHSNESIDPERTKDNYSLVKDGGYEKYKERMSEVHCMKRDNINVLGEFVITMPKDVKPKDEKQFFEICLDFAVKDLGVKNIVAANVHKDEKKPHIHIDFIPVVNGHLRDKAKTPVEKVNWDKKITQSYYQKFHKRLSEYVKEHLGYEVEILNGATAGGNKTVKELKAEAAAAKAEALEKEAEELENNISELNTKKEQIQADIDAKIANEKKDIEVATKEAKDDLKDTQIAVDKLDKKAIELENKLADKMSELQGVEKEQGELQVAVDELDGKVFKLQTDLKNKNDELTEINAAIARQKDAKRAAAAEAEEAQTATANLQSELTAMQERINALDKQEKEQAKRVNGVDSSNIEIEQIKADIKPSKIQRDKSVISTDKLNSLIELAEQGQAAIAANAQTQKKMKNMVSVEQYRSATNTLLEKNTALKDENNALKAEVKEKQGVIEKIQAQFEKFKAAALKLDLFDKIMELIKRTEKEPEQENKKSSPKKQIGR